MRRERLCWPERPRRARHCWLGVRQRWWSRCGRFLIERFLDGTRRFIVLWIPYGQRRPYPIGKSRLTLRRAKAACERKAREVAKSCQLSMVSGQ